METQSTEPVAPPGFCNRREVRYGSIGGLEYEVPQGICSVIRRSFMAMKAHVLHNFWTSIHRGEASPLPALAAPLKELKIKRIPHTNYPYKDELSRPEIHSAVPRNKVSTKVRISYKIVRILLLKQS